MLECCQFGHLHKNTFSLCKTLPDFKKLGKTLQLSKKLAEIGLLVTAIRPPTVEKNKARLRISFNAQHKKRDIKKLAEFIIKTMSF